MNPINPAPVYSRISHHRSFEFLLNSIIPNTHDWWRCEQHILGRQSQNQTRFWSSPLCLGSSLRRNRRSISWSGWSPKKRATISATSRPCLCGLADIVRLGVPREGSAWIWGVGRFLGRSIVSRQSIVWKAICSDHYSHSGDTVDLVFVGSTVVRPSPYRSWTRPLLLVSRLRCLME